MRMIMSVGIVATLTLAAIVTWTATRTTARSQAEASAAMEPRVNPLEIMMKSKDLPAHPAADGL